MKKKSIFCCKLFIGIFIILCLGMVLYPFIATPQIKLTQLSPQGSRQMMGYLLKTKEGKLIVIDGGTLEDTNQLIEQINQNGGKVEAWFLTHAHDDHVGAFTQIINNTDMEVNAIYVSPNELAWYEEYEPQRADFTKTFLDTLNSEKIKNKVVNPNLNETFEIEGIKVEILGIRNPEITENAGNEQSMVIKFTTDHHCFLVLGDTGEKSSQKLLATQKEKLKSDIVQMAHHGQAGATKELYEAVDPKICLWPTPEWLWNNDAGEGKNTGPWKTMETRSWIEQLQVKKNYIAKDGNKTIEI